MAARTKDDLIDVLRRTMDGGYLDPILEDADAVAPINAAADALARLSLEAEEACANITISDSAAGRGGSSAVTLTRASTGVGGTIPKGYVFVDARGLVAVTTSDTTVAAGAASVQVLVQTIRKTELVDTIDDPEFSIGPNLATVDSGGTNALIGQSPAPSGYPPIVATTFTTVASSTPIDGGASDWLAAVGKERGQIRQANEDDGSFRVRVRNVPDAVSPVAVSEGALGAASRVALPPPYILEPFNLGLSLEARAAAQVDWFDTLYFSGELDAIGNRDLASPRRDFMEDIQPDATNLKVREMVSLREASAYFRVVIPGLLPDPDSGRIFYEEAFFDDPVLGFPDVHDSTTLVGALMAVWEECNRKRAGGVRFDEYLEMTKRVTGRGTRSNIAEGVVFTLTPPVGTRWLMMDGHFGWDAPSIPGFASARLRFTFAGGSTYTTPFDQTSWGQRVNGKDVVGADLVSREITSVEGLLASDGVTTANLVANLVVLEVAV